MNDFVMACVAVLMFEWALILLLHSFSRLGSPGRAIADRCIRAPGLDLVVSLLTWVPWVVAAWAGGWTGLAGCLVGQVLVLYTWIFAHSLAHREAARGPNLVREHHRLLGPLRNQAALWFTAPALPVFWMLRLAEVLLYPFLRMLTDFPRYKQSEWVNVGRQKFQGLVGHDLIWCLYCDWMTGVYSLGGEMLRNVESFWCPIRFYEGKKCDNCRIDFPDVDAWVPPDGDMAAVHAMFMEKYGDGERSWFGHPARLTVEGEAPGQAPPAE